MDGQLEALMTYTVFHLGVYVSLVTAVLAASTYSGNYHWTLKSAVVCFLIAGMAGGLVASNIPEHAKFKTFSEERLKAYGFDTIGYHRASQIEHGAFWLGLLGPSIAFVCGCLKGKSR